MSRILGFDTSNYTTSAAYYDTATGEIFQSKMLLPVKAGEKGVRQSDAVFHHTAQLPQVISALREKCGGFDGIDAIGVSTRPRSLEGSYMPCFTVGSGTAHILSDFLIRHKAEVMDVVLTEYDEAKHMKLIEKEAEARGEAIGQARGEAIGQARGQIIGAIKLAQMNPNISDVEIVSSIMELFELPEDEAWEYFRSYK